MDCGYRQGIITLVCGLWAIAVISGAAVERQDVTIKLYQASKSDWTSIGRAKFKTILAEEASEYCRDNTAMCLMIDAAQPTFSTSGYDEASAAKEKAYLVVVFSQEFPSRNDMMAGHEDDLYLNHDALQAITINAAKKFREQTDLTIVDVDNKPQPLPPDNTMNIAISVTAVAILLIMIVALLIMQHKCGGHEHELLAQKEEAANNQTEEENKVAARGGTVATLQSVVTDDQLPAKKHPTDVQTTDM